MIENAHLLNLNVSRISRLKKWQRRSIYALTGLLGLGLIGTIFYMVMIVAQYDVAYSKEQNKVAAQNKQLDIYEQGLLGKHDVLLDYFKATKTNLSDEEKKIYANLLLKDKKYKELVSLYNNDSGYIATMISKQGDINALRAFHKDFPSNESTFDLLYADKKYKELLAVKDVDMTVKRSEMKTYALMKTGKIEEANAELANNNNKDLKAKITQYEKLSKELKEFNEAIKVAKDSKKRKKLRLYQRRKPIWRNNLTPFKGCS